MRYIQAVLEINSKEDREIAIAQLAEEGFDSFEETDHQLTAYISEDYHDISAVKKLLGEYNVEFATTIIEQQNWNEQWEQNFSPVKVDGFCTIRATFHEPDNTVPHEIIITPKMSFGTGHHATTRLMIQQMSSLDIKNKTVFDFGTGTGVLAILAKKLGSGSVMAIDTDEWSYENTIENIGYNDVEGIEVKKGSLEVADGAYDIILANINRHILIQYMKDMKAMLCEHGVILMSGILREDEEIIKQEAVKANLQMQSMNSEEQWICLKFTHA